MSTPRVSRKEQRRRELEQQKRRRNLQLGIGLGVAAIVVAALVLSRQVRASIEGLVKFGAQARGHDEGVVIEAGDLPPVGGTHSPSWQNCGVYDQPVEIKNAIHSMEHGAVWITYQPELAAGEVETLRNLVRGQTYLLLSPYPGLRSPVVLTAWGVQLEVDSADDERVEQFIGEYRLGPQTPELGATCDGGIGTPIG